MLSDKRRLLRDEETKLHEVERKIRDKQFHERTIAEKLKNEYDDLRNRFEQMAFELRFSIEDELRIYARLLDELMKKSSVVTTQQTGSTSTIQQGGSTSTTISSVIRSTGIENRDTPSTYQQIHSTSSTTGPGNVAFDLGSGNSTWTNLGGNEGSLRSSDNETSSVTQTSSYSHLN
jgi:hypothetical protein